MLQKNGGCPETLPQVPGTFSPFRLLAVAVDSHLFLLSLGCVKKQGAAELPRPVSQTETKRPRSPERGTHMKIKKETRQNCRAISTHYSVTQYALTQTSATLRSRDYDPILADQPLSYERCLYQIHDTEYNQTLHQDNHQTLGE